MNPTPKVRCALYARHSTAEQQSIPAQLEALREYATRRAVFVAQLRTTESALAKIHSVPPAVDTTSDIGTSFEGVGSWTDPDWTSMRR